FKAHCAFGFWHQGMVKVLADDGVKADDAMGSFGKLTGLADLPADRTLLRYIRAAVKLNESEEPARKKPVGKPAKSEVPGDLAAALKKNKEAAATFEGFSQSKRNEYIEWLTEAKRDETRQKRLATTLEWLAEGKARNWKYENC
ncbi:MAG: YdeI/OmpD-associated family protein, partial [Thermoanaerobaculia bacterium]